MTSRIMRLLSLLSVLLIGVSQLAVSQAPGAFARLGFGARGMSMGNALVANSFGSTSPYYNPALAPFAADQTVDIGAALMSDDRGLQYLQFALPLRPSGGIGIGLINATVSNIDGRDASGYHTENYRSSEIAGYAAFGLKLGSRMSAGIGVRGYRSNLLADLTAAYTIGLSFGLTYRPTPQLSVAMAVDDLLAEFDWDSSSLYGAEDGVRRSDRFPIRVRLGSAYQMMNGQTIVSFEYEAAFQSVTALSPDVQVIGGLPELITQTDSLRLASAQLKFGAEYWMTEPFAIRVGVDRASSQGFGLVRPSAGVSFRKEVGDLGLRVDYAFIMEPLSRGSINLVVLKLRL